ncbi:uncharacterized protein [Procambarus clarkii]|uniref:uncharacterized protein n=1 Tax=Procambarus clarkii TaxID=6728 RepID=UPI00374341CE
MDTRRVEVGWREVVVVGVWAVGAMVVTWSYCCNLMSQLTVRHVPMPVQTITDLVNHKSYTVIMEPNNIVTDTLANSKSGEYLKLYRLGEVGRVKLQHAASFPKALDTLVKRGDHALITNSVGADLLISNLFHQTGRCDVYKARQTFITSTYCMIGQRGSPVIPSMNHW